MAAFIIMTTAKGHYRYTLCTEDSKTVLTGKTHSKKSSVRSSIELVKKNAQNDTQYERKTSQFPWNPYFFVLKDAKGEVIGTSEEYPSTFARDEAIELVKQIAPIATIIDESEW